MANRAQKLAAIRAHSILPESLRWVVKKHGNELFEGIDAGMQVPYTQVNGSVIDRETLRITELIDGRAPFSRVVFQMGYVSGLLGQWLNPSKSRSETAQRGFDYYTNAKLQRFLFVFDGYDELRQHATPSDYLSSVAGPLDNYGRLLDLNYHRIGGNWRYVFDERSAVFGVCAIYFSNVARCSAQLWRHAWHNARGDATKTPFVIVDASQLESIQNAP